MKAFFYSEAIPNSEAGVRVSKARFIRIPFAWYFRSNILNKQHLWNDLLSHKARYTNVLFD